MPSDGRLLDCEETRLAGKSACSTCARDIPRQRGADASVCQSAGSRRYSQSPLRARFRKQLPTLGPSGSVTFCTDSDRRGSALLAVLWLTAALSAIAFTVANTVRAETERTSTDVDSVKAYYLAAGAINRAIVHIEWGPRYRSPDGSTKVGGPSVVTVMNFEFPSGSAVVNIIPEAAKLNLNQAPPEQLMRLLVALGEPLEQAQAITQE